MWRLLGVPSSRLASKLSADGVPNFDRCHSGADRERLSIDSCGAKKLHRCSFSYMCLYASIEDDFGPEFFAFEFLVFYTHAACDTCTSCQEGCKSLVFESDVEGRSNLSQNLV